MQQHISAHAAHSKIILHVAWRVFTASFTLFLLLVFGGFIWPQAFVFAGLSLFGQLAVTARVSACQPALLAKRIRTPNHFLSLILICAWTPIAGYCRSDWLIAPLGAPIMVCGYALAGWALCTNPFAIEETGIQEGQYVIETGPYAYWRHPIYLANVLLAIGAGLLLGAGACLVAIPTIIASIGRARQEDDLLGRGLWGYRHYAARVRGML